MSEKQFGDLVVRKSDPSMGGFDVYVMNSDPDQDWEKVCFFNTRGAIGLKEWIEENFEDDRARDDLTSPGVALSAPDDEGFQTLVSEEMAGCDPRDLPDNPEGKKAE